MWFYESLGYKQNPQFTDETVASVVISDTIYVMLPTHATFKIFDNRYLLMYIRKVELVL